MEWSTHQIVRIEKNTDVFHQLLIFAVAIQETFGIFVKILVFNILLTLSDVMVYTCCLDLENSDKIFCIELLQRFEAMPIVNEGILLFNRLTKTHISSSRAALQNCITKTNSKFDYTGYTFWTHVVHKEIHLEVPTFSYLIIF